MSRTPFAERTKYTQNFPYPECGATIYENPPTFIWVPVEGAREYTVCIFDSEGVLLETLTESKHYVTPSLHFEPKTYFWSIKSDNGYERERYSFTISPDALDFEPVLAEELFSAVPAERPRHLFSASDIPALKEKKRGALRTLKRNVEIAMTHGSPERPMFHRDAAAKPYREYFGEYRDFVDRDLVAASLWYALTGDAVVGEYAKGLFLDICDMNPNGPCSQNGGYGDEVGLSNARCLPAVFDLIYPLLDEKKRKYAALTVAAYARQSYDRIKRINYAENPSDSHVGRIPAYLGEAALVLKGEGVVSDAELLSWLELSLDIYCGIFPYYGGKDGSWAEGTFYSTSYTKWYLPFFSVVERYTGKSLAEKPFYHRYTNFLLHFCNPDYELHPFGDGYWCSPESPEWPGFFAQNPYRYYAERFGPDAARERMAAAEEQEIYKLHLLDIFLPIKPVSRSLAHEPRDVEAFPDGGFAAIHSEFGAKDDICVLARASRFGSDSHRHADQGSFAIFAGGTALITPSGYFGRRYGTKHHLEWTNTTAAHNTLLFNGVGQPTFSMESRGKIVSVNEDEKCVLLDMSEAYPNINLWQREITLSGDTVTVRDTVEADEPVTVDYLLHSLSEPKSDGNSVVVERAGKRVNVTPTSGNLVLSSVTDKFGVDLNDGEPIEYAVEMPKQYHITYKAEAKRRHEPAVEYKIEQ